LQPRPTGILYLNHGLRRKREPAGTIAGLCYEQKPHGCLRDRDYCRSGIAGGGGLDDGSSVRPGGHETGGIDGSHRVVQ
jgi:hypothetical protein